MKIVMAAILAIFPIAMFTPCSAGQAAPAAGEEKFVFETWTKQKIEALRGSFSVPENRKVRGGGTIQIGYVRLTATGNKSGPPIVYLAGGPGGSGIAAINYRYRMFMEMRKHGDVIALDQRGTGVSNIVPSCHSSQVVPTTTEVSDDRYAEYQRAALKECLAFWRQNDVDLAGYNTIENARDLDALRRHLGAEKLILWGTSYGSHLALAALKEIEPHVAKVVISSVEGLNQTIKLPARADEYLGRLQEAINDQPAAKAAYPDIRELMRRVHAKLDRKPVWVQLKSRTGAQQNYLLQRRDMQLLAAALIADPKSAAQLLGVYLALDQGVPPSFESIPARLLSDNLVDPGSPISLEGMPVAMDIASGMTEKHRLLISEQAKTAILGEYLDYTFHFAGMAPELDLGDAYRANPTSDVPVLVLSGTLDGRTPIESQREAVSGLKNVAIVTVRNAGHNLFDEPSDELLATIHRFMEGRRVDNAVITVDLQNMARRTF